MPHITKGGKYIFGWTIIRDEGTIFLPEEVMKEYDLAEFEKVIVISGSKATGGIVVAKNEKIQRSKISNVLSENQRLAKFQITDGELIKYKGRLYCWTAINPGGLIKLPQKVMKELGITSRDNLLVIRGSNMGFVMGVKGPLIEKAKDHPEIPVFG
ncbi:Uncharacterised protein [uncultured archaeon]|nr:Uncharacterised protein [uncultured archaeon]